MKDKEFVVLLGPSGCGKTTTLRCVAGLESPDDGEIYIGDRLVNDLDPRDRNIAMVFQSYALYPHMSVYQNMAFPLENAKVPEREIVERVNRTARLLQIEGLLSRKPAQLSGGQRQRVALGRAIVREPTVFLMDEPLSNLDAQLRVHMRAELKPLQTDIVRTGPLGHSSAGPHGQRGGFVGHRRGGPSPIPILLGPGRNLHDGTTGRRDHPRPEGGRHAPEGARGSDLRGRRGHASGHP